MTEARCETQETANTTTLPASERAKHDCPLTRWLRESADRHEAAGRSVSALLRRNEAVWMETLDGAVVPSVVVHRKPLASAAVRQ